MSAIHLTIEECHARCIAAALGAGAHAAAAESLARAVVAAEAAGNRSVGIAHLPVYLEALVEGRIDGAAKPRIEQPLPAILHADANGGIAHLGYDLAHQRLCTAARSFGVAVFAQNNAFTCGELGYFARRLANEGMVALAATNGPALITVPGGRRPVYCTNPLAFAAPLGEGGVLLFDQSSSETAFVKVRQAAERGETIPQGWAIDADGRPTTDAAAAIGGALLTFGGARGANIALMVEILAAGLGRANWSLDAPSISQGSASPGTGLFIVAIAPAAFGPDFPNRLAAHARRLEAEGVHIPGRGKAEMLKNTRREGLRIPRRLMEAIDAYAERA